MCDAGLYDAKLLQPTFHGISMAMLLVTLM